MLERVEREGVAIGMLGTIAILAMLWLGIEGKEIVLGISMGLVGYIGRKSGNNGSG